MRGTSVISKRPGGLRTDLAAMVLLGQKLGLTLLRLHTHLDRAHLNRIDVEHHGDRLASDLRHLIKVPRLREDAPERGHRNRPPVARPHDVDAMSQGGRFRFHGSTIVPASARIPRCGRLAGQDGRLEVGAVLGPPVPAAIEPLLAAHRIGQFGVPRHRERVEASWRSGSSPTGTGAPSKPDPEMVLLDARRPGRNSRALN